MLSATRRGFMRFAGKVAFGLVAFVPASKILLTQGAPRSSPIPHG
jgi:hypothetical protein